MKKEKKSTDMWFSDKTEASLCNEIAEASIHPLNR